MRARGETSTFPFSKWYDIALAIVNKKKLRAKSRTSRIMWNTAEVRDKKLRVI